MNTINKTQYLKPLNRGTFKIGLNIFLLNEINAIATTNKLKSETTMPVLILLNVRFDVHFVKNNLKLNVQTSLCLTHPNSGGTLFCRSLDSFCLLQHFLQHPFSATS